MSSRPARSPLSRVVNVERAIAEGREVTVTATAEECAALASDFAIEAVRDLAGQFRLGGSPERLEVSGRVTAFVTQICTVSLEPFESRVDEPVEVDFSDLPDVTESDSPSLETPDPIVNGRLDLGALTAEFLALGLDPFPRKPGVTFEAVSVGEDDSPFAALARLRDDKT